MKIDIFDLIVLLLHIIPTIGLLVIIAVYEPLGIYIVGAAIMITAIIVAASVFINCLWPSERESEDNYE